MTATTETRDEIAAQLLEEHEHEMNTAPSVWEEWLWKVSAFSGIEDLDGDQDIDGYSLDSLYDLFREEFTVAQACAAIDGWREQVSS